MAEQIDISKIVVVDTFITDLKEAERWVLRVNEAIQGMNKAEVSVKGVSGITSLNKSIDQLTAANKVLAESISSIDKAQANSSVSTSGNTAKTREATAATKERQKAIEELNSKYQSALVLSKNLTDQFGAESVQAKNASRSAQELKSQIDQLSTGKAVSAKGPDLSGYEKLKKETKEAELNAKNLATQFGADSKEALQAAAAYDLLRQKLELVNSVTKRTTSTNQPQSTPAEVPFTSNVQNVNEENLKTINATGEAVNNLEKAESEAANTATAWGSSQLEANAALDEGAKVLPEIVTELDVYTGSISQNIKAQLENNVALAENRAAQKELQNTLSTNGRLTDEQTAKLITLKTEELSLVSINKDLTTTIRNQVVAYTTAEGSTDQLTAKVALLQKAYAGLSVEEKKSQTGVNLKAQIDQLEPTLVKAESEVGKYSRGVGNYAGGITKVFGSAFGYLRQLAYVIPGLGMAGIINLVSEAVISLSADLIDFESAEAKAERETKQLTLTLKQQSDAFNDFKDSVTRAVDKTVAKLKELGATQFEVENAKLTGIGLNKGQVESVAKGNIEVLNSYLNQLKGKKEELSHIFLDFDHVGATAEKESDKKHFFATPLPKLADISISEGDIANYQKVKDIVNQIQTLETDKSFGKLTGAEKQTFTQIKTLTESILGNVKDVKKYADDVAQILAEQKAEQITEIRNATRERLVSEVETTASITERNKKAILDSIQYERDVKAGNFDALKKKVIAERDFELNAEKGKIDAINKVRALELAKPENTEADKIRINAQADREIAAAKKTEAERIKIRKEADSKLFDIDDEKRKRDIEAEKQVYVQERQTKIKLLDELSQSSEFSVSDRLTFTQTSYQLQKEVIEKEHEALLESKKNVTLTAKEKLQIETDYETQIIDLNRKTSKETTDILKSEIEKQQQLRERDLENIDRLFNSFGLVASEQYSKDVVALNESLKQKLVGYNEYLKKRKELDDEYNNKSQQNSIDDIVKKLSRPVFENADKVFSKAQENLDFLKSKLNAPGTTDEQKETIARLLQTAQKDYDIAKNNVDKKVELEKQLNDLIVQLSDNTLHQEEEKKKKLFDSIAGYLQQLAGLANQVSSIGDSVHQKRIDQIEAESQALDEAYAKERDLITQSTTSQLDQQRKLTEAEKRYNSQKHQLAEQEKQEKLKQAKFQKEAAILEIIVRTAANIVSAFPNPAAMITAGVIGGVELAVAAAAPLPQFFKGKNFENKDSYEGFGLWGEGRDGKGNARELLLHEDGSYEVSGDKPEVKYFKQNDVIVPHAATEKIISKQSTDKRFHETLIRENRTYRHALLPDIKQIAWSATVPAIDPFVHVTVSNDNEQLSRDVRQAGKNIVSAIKNQPKPRRMDPNYEMMRAWIKSNKNWTDMFS